MRFQAKISYKETHCALDTDTESFRADKQNEDFKSTNSNHHQNGKWAGIRT